MAAFINTLISIFDLAGKIYISIVLFRFLLQTVKADFYNPISQFIVKATHPLLKPLRQIIPSIGRQDTSSLLLAYLLQLLLVIINIAIIYFIIGLLPTTSVLTLLLIALIRLVDLIFNLFYLLFLVAFVLSILAWLIPVHRSSAAILIEQVTNSLLKPLRRFIPTIGVIDITPMVALILLLLINNVILGTINYFFGIQGGLLVITGG